MLVSVLTLRADKIVPIGLTLIAYELEPPLTLIAELVYVLTLIADKIMHVGLVLIA